MVQLNKRPKPRVNKFAKPRQSIGRAGSDEFQRLLDGFQTRQLDLETQCQALQEALAELEESRDRFSTFYDFAPVGHVTFDGEGCIREINLAGAALIDWERSQLIGIPMTFMVVRDDIKLFLDHLQRCRQTKEKVITELSLARGNGSPLQVQLLSVPLSNGNGTYYSTVIIDITEQKRLEKELSRFDRLNLVGEMAAGIAHEIRNPMTTVRGFLQLFRDKSEFIQYREHFDLMIEELDRANTIITEFLSLAKNKSINLNCQNLNSIINALFPLLQADALRTDKNVRLELEDVPDLLVDGKEIRQLILNLAINGLQAMPAGGNLIIKTFLEGAEVVLAVQDQGEGIKPGVLEKIGTPFFTTKEQGTGLGLAVCYRIAARHNAVIRVETGVWGTIFFVRFRLT